MTASLLKLLKKGDYDQAHRVSLTYLDEHAIMFKDPLFMESTTKLLVTLTQYFTRANKLDEIYEILTLFLNLKQIPQPLHTKYYFTQLGVNKSVKTCLNSKSYTKLIKIFDKFNFVEDNAIFKYCFSYLVKDYEYNLSFEFLKKRKTYLDKNQTQADNKRDPLYTEVGLLSYYASKGVIIPVLDFIRENNLSSTPPISQMSDNVFLDETERVEVDSTKIDVVPLIVELLKQGDIKNGLHYINLFNLKSKTDFDNKSYKIFTDASLIKLMLKKLQFEYVETYIQESPFKERLELMFPFKSMIRLIIKQRDWLALKKFLKKEKFKSLLEKDKTSEPSYQFMTIFIQSFIDIAEYGRALKYVKKYSLESLFPVKSLLERIIKRHNYGVLLKLDKKYNLESELKQLEKELQINRVLALKQYRRNFDQDRQKVNQGLVLSKRGMVQKLIFKREEIDVRKELVPFDDDHLLVQTSDQFFKFLKDSNNNIKLCQKATVPFAPRPSPRLQDFVLLRSVEEQKPMMNMNVNMNVQAEEWSPSLLSSQNLSQTQSQSQTQSFNMDSLASYQSQTQSYGQGHGERKKYPVSSQLQQAMGGSSQMGRPAVGVGRSSNNILASPPGFQFQSPGGGGAQQRPRNDSLQRHDSFQRSDSFQRNDSFRRHESFQRSNSFQRTNSFQRHNSFNQQDQFQRQQSFTDKDMFQFGAGHGYSDQAEKEMNRQRARQQEYERHQRQREVELGRQRQRNDFSHLEKVEKMVNGLLQLNREAKSVQRALGALTDRYHLAKREGNSQELHVIEKEYYQLKQIKASHQEKEKRVINCARTDTAVYEAIQIFQQRRKEMALNRQTQSQAKPRVQGHGASPDIRSRQSFRLRQHELEKQQQQQQQQYKDIRRQQYNDLYRSRTNTQQSFNSSSDLFRGNSTSSEFNTGAPEFQPRTGSAAEPSETFRHTYKDTNIQIQQFQASFQKSALLGTGGRGSNRAQESFDFKDDEFEFDFNDDMIEATNSLKSQQVQREEVSGIGGVNMTEVNIEESNNDDQIEQTQTQSDNSFDFQQFQEKNGFLNDSNDFNQR